MQLLNIIYNILLSPAQEFRVVALGPVPKERLLGYSLLFVGIISAGGVIYSPVVHSTDGLMLKVLLSALTGLVFWLFTAGIYATTAYTFGIHGRPRTLLILTGYATLPWIFLPVAVLFKGFLGTFGQTISVFASLGIWLWAAILFLMALKHTYSLTIERVLLIAAIPLLMAFLGIAWVGGFFFNLIQIFS
jgi:Yip1 domain